MKRALLAALFLAVCGTAAAQPREPRPEPIILGRAQTSQLIGLSQDDIRAALGAPRREATYVTTVRLEDGVLVTELWGDRIFGENPCPQRFRRIELSAPDIAPYSRRVDVFVFRDGRLAEIRTRGRAAVRGPAAPDDEFTMACHNSVRGDRGEQVFMGAAALVVFGPIMGPAAIYDAATDESDVREHALSVLRLGEPLAGGIDGYLSAHDGVITVARHEGEDADLDLAIEKHARRFNGTNLIRIEVRGGVVTGIVSKAWQECELSAERALHCPGRWGR